MVQRSHQELLATGVATVSNDDEAIAYAMTVLQKRLEQAKKPKKELLAKQNAKLQPKADFADAAFATGDKVDVGQSAKILNLGFGRNTLFQKLRERGVSLPTGTNRSNNTSMQDTLN